jgi:hypothetical protein
MEQKQKRNYAEYDQIRSDTNETIQSVTVKTIVHCNRLNCFVCITSYLIIFQHFSTFEMTKWQKDD